MPEQEFTKLITLIDIVKPVKSFLFSFSHTILYMKNEFKLGKLICLSFAASVLLFSIISVAGSFMCKSKDLACYFGVDSGRLVIKLNATASEMPSRISLNIPHVNYNAMINDRQKKLHLSNTLVQAKNCPDKNAEKIVLLKSTIGLKQIFIDTEFCENVYLYLDEKFFYFDLHDIFSNSLIQIETFDLQVSQSNKYSSTNAEYSAIILLKQIASRLQSSNFKFASGNLSDIISQFLMVFTGIFYCLILRKTKAVRDVSVKLIAVFIFLNSISSVLGEFVINSLIIILGLGLFIKSVIRART